MSNPTPTVKPTKTFAALKNVIECMKVVNRLIERPTGMSGFGMFYGPSGFGKPEAARYARNQTRGILVEIGESWNRRTLMKKILSEGGFPNMKGTVADLTEHVIMMLGDDPRRPLIIDEADKLITKGFVELVREVHENSRAPVLLVGEELLPKRLQPIERVHNRLIATTGAMPCDLQDCRKLADIFLGEVGIDDDLLDVVRQETQGRARRLVATFHGMKEFARNRGLRQLNRSNYTDGYFTNAVPAKRQFDDTMNVVHIKGARA